MSAGNSSPQLDARHIQDFHNAAKLEPHWGYVGRVLPCTNDAGSCRYLDTVYHSHDLSMLYTFIMWAVLGGILLSWAALRLFRTLGSGRSADREAVRKAQLNPGFLARSFGAVRASGRRVLLPVAMPKVFGHASRLQVLILFILTSYLIIFSFVGLVYAHWVTPVKGTKLTNYRSTLGPWSDRIGALAYALTPFTVALATRESILSLLTGIPYQHFNFLHIWTGRIIYLQGTLHTIAWTVIEARLYQPQPKVWRAFIKQEYMIYGVAAMALLTILFVHSLKSVIRLTGYEFFRKTHYIVAMIYIGTCWGHWQQLKCWMIAALGIWGIDRAVRFLRVALIHFGRKDMTKGFGFKAAQANVRTFVDGDATVVRLDFEQPHAPWKVGQHFYLCFPALTIWQSHPMTPMSLPSASGVQKHTYIIRALKGETARLAKLGLPSSDKFDSAVTTPVVLTGPSAVGVKTSPNVMAIAGGTGISFALPVFLEALNRAEQVGFGAVSLVWVIREAKNMEWIREELAVIKARVAESKVNDVRVTVFVTRESGPTTSSRTSTDDEKNRVAVTDEKVHSVSSNSSTTDLTSATANFSVKYLGSHHPDFSGANGVLEEWEALAAAHGGKQQVYASGPSGMGVDLRVHVAARNEGGKAFSGKGGDVAFYWDDRMG